MRSFVQNMDNQILVFGSFSEDEACQFQSSVELPRRASISTTDNTLPRMISRLGSVPVDAAEVAHEPTFCNGFSQISISEPSGNHISSNSNVHTNTVCVDNFREEKVISLDKSVDKKEDVTPSEKLGRLYSDNHRNRKDMISDGKNFVWTKKAVTKSRTEFPVPDTDPRKSSPADRVCERDNKSELIATEAMQLTKLSGESWQQSLNNANLVERRLEPRGLINKGNLCFLTATLQGLLSCSPFVHLLHTLQARGVPEAGFPALHACVDFFKEFEYQENDVKKVRTSLELGKPFLPSMFEGILHSFTRVQPVTGIARNRQEDAQEFLSFLMDQLHNELLQLEASDKIATSTVNCTPSVIDEDDWETVGPKNRTAVVRTHAFGKSALSDIFGGELCSIVKSKGLKASATVEPFSVLHLDILPEAVHTVDDALKLFAAPESLEGYRTTTGKASASKSVKLHTLPRVLILHLKRFSYGPQGSSKLHKHLHFPFDLTLGRDLLANTRTGSESRCYELVATITHHGKDLYRGHYTAHSKQLDGQWLRYDDGVVSVASPGRVLQEQVYLLFYRRHSV